MRDWFSNMWVKRCVSVFTLSYAAVITLLTLASFLYDLVFVEEKKAAFLVVYGLAALVFLVLMIYTRDIFMTKLISVLLLPIVFFLLIFNIKNGNWILIVPPFIVAITMFFASGANETLKVILGTIYLLLYVLGIVAYVLCNMLFGSTSVETTLDMNLDPKSTVYSYYKNDLQHLSELVSDDNAISPDGRYRFYLADVKDNKDGCLKIYVVPSGKDIKLKFFSLNEKGIRKKIATNGTRGVVPPSVGWTVIQEDGKNILYLAYRLTPQDTSWKLSKVTNMPKKDYLEFLGLDT